MAETSTATRVLLLLNWWCNTLRGLLCCRSLLLLLLHQKGGTFALQALAFGKQPLLLRGHVGAVPLGFSQQTLALNVVVLLQLLKCRAVAFDAQLVVQHLLLPQLNFLQDALDGGLARRSSKRKLRQTRWHVVGENNTRCGHLLLCRRRRDALKLGRGSFEYWKGGGRRFLCCVRFPLDESCLRDRLLLLGDFGC